MNDYSAKEFFYDESFEDYENKCQMFFTGQQLPLNLRIAPAGVGKSRIIDHFISVTKASDYDVLVIDHINLIQSQPRTERKNNEIKIQQIDEMMEKFANICKVRAKYFNV